MPQIQTLRAFVQQRLIVASEEIFELFERTIAEYEEKLCRQRKLLDVVFKPQVHLHRADVQLLSEVPPDLQELSPSLDQNDKTELAHIKEEQEELWISQEGEQLQGLEEADIVKFTFSPMPVKTEEDDTEILQSSQIHYTEEMEAEADGEDCGGPELQRDFNPEIHLQFDDGTSLSSEPETIHSCDRKVTSVALSGLRLMRKIEEAECNVVQTPVSYSECTSNFGLTRHQQEHSGENSEVETFSCSVCQKTFPFMANLLTHMRVHTGENSFSCTVCGKRFEQRGNLLQHMRIHTGEKPFGCSVCGSRFRYSKCLKRHQRVHTGEKPFSCSLCGGRFTLKTSLRDHMRIHSGEKPFVCDVCGKQFVASGTMRRHMRTHKGEKPLSCSVCDRNFTQISNLKQHRCVGESSGMR